MPPRIPLEHLKYGVIGGALLLLIGLVVFFIVDKPTPTPSEVEAPTEPLVEPEQPWQTMSVIGSSVEGRAIEAHTYGTGSTSLLFVGGVHGGYEWNSVVLAYEMMDHLANFPETVPADLTIHIIPSLNPDGVYAVTQKTGRLTVADIPNPSQRIGSARFNANGVDLNRNFDCKWQPKSTWRGAEVSAGTAPFSEPEAAALRDYVTRVQPAAAIFWHSQANNVYASECEAGVLPATITLMNTYAQAAGYGAVESFDAYPISGDAEGWLASIGIPAVTVELKTFSSSEWPQNWAATNAVMQLYSTER